MENHSLFCEWKEDTGEISESVHQKQRAATRLAGGEEF